MGDYSDKPTETDFRIAFSGKYFQMKAHRVPFTWETRAWLINEAEVTAAQYAYERKLQNILHEEMHYG